MSAAPVSPSLLSRIPPEARSILIVGFERHAAAEQLAARPDVDIVCVEWYDNAIVDARSLFTTVVAMPLSDAALSLCAQPFDCIVITHLRGLSLSLSQALELLKPCLDEAGSIVFSVANPTYGPYGIIEHCQIGFTPVEVFDLAADAGLRLTARWPIIDARVRDSRVDETGHVTLFGERYRVEPPDMLEDIVALEHQYCATHAPAGTGAPNSVRPEESSLRSR